MLKLPLPSASSATRAGDFVGELEEEALEAFEPCEARGGVLGGVCSSGSAGSGATKSRGESGMSPGNKEDLGGERGGVGQPSAEFSSSRTMKPRAARWILVAASRRLSAA